jgi:hypothetical protein
MQHIAGWHQLDENSTHKKVPAHARIVKNSNTKGVRIGIPRKYFFDHVPSKVESLFFDCIEILRSAGSVVLHDLDLHNTEQYQRAWQNAGSCANNWTSVYGPDNYVNGLLL